MDDLVLGHQLFLYAKLEEYVVRGALNDIAHNVITQKEGEQVLRLGRFQTDVPGLFNKYLKPEGDEMLPQVILFKNKDKVIPVDDLKPHCDEFTKTFSLTATKDGKMLVRRDTGQIVPATLNAQMEKFKASTMIVSLSNEDVGEDKIQPFHLLGDEKSPSLVVFIQGDVSCLDKIRKKIAKEMKTAESAEVLWRNISVEDGNEDCIGDEIETLVPDSTCLIFVYSGGQAATFQKGNIEVEHDWGWSYGQDKPSDGGETVDDKSADDSAKEDADNPFGDLSAPVTADTLATAATAIPPADSTKKRVLPSGKPIARLRKGEIQGYAKKALVNGNGVFGFKDAFEPFVHCPELNADGSKISKEDNHIWHMKHIGIIPENWEHKPLFPASALITEVKIDLKKVKDATSAAALNRPTAKSMVLDEAKVREFQATTLPKLVGNNQELIANPDAILEHEKNVKPIHVAMGHDNIFPTLYPYLARLHVTTDDPEIAAHFWGDWQRAAIQFYQENLKLKADLDEATKPKDDAAAFGDVTK